MSGAITNQVFLFTDAHGNNLTGIGHLFATGAIVKVILSVDEGKAYIQNADTNAYLEDKFANSGYSKEETLTDETKGDFGLDALAVPDDVFGVIHAKLKLIMDGVAEIAVTVKSKSGNPVSGVLVSGVFDSAGNGVYTDKSGVAVGYVAEGSVTLSISGYADIADFSETMAVTKGESYTKEIVVTTRNFLKITSSKNVKFSGNVSRVDVSVGGGGGSGSRTTSNTPTGGGGGGYSTIKENVDFEPNTSYAAVVGSGGAAMSSGGTTGSAGGLSSFLGVSAAGGNGGTTSAGGTGNGKGGWCTSNRNKTTNGGNGTTYIYTSFAEQSLYGGGGGSYYLVYGEYDDSWTATAGSPGGGKGGFTDAGAGTNYLGGGGGGCSTIYGGDKSGAGGKGVVAIRMHLTAA